MYANIFLILGRILPDYDTRDVGLSNSTNSHVLVTLTGALAQNHDLRNTIFKKLLDIRETFVLFVQ